MEAEFIKNYWKGPRAITYHMKDKTNQARAPEENNAQFAPNIVLTLVNYSASSKH